VVYVQAIERAMHLVARPVLGRGFMSGTIALPSFTVEHLLFVVVLRASGSGIWSGIRIRYREWRGTPRSATRYCATNWSPTLVKFM
jgi:hypothetical protein